NEDSIESSECLACRGNRRIPAGPRTTRRFQPSFVRARHSTAKGRRLVDAWGLIYLPSPAPTPVQTIVKLAVAAGHCAIRVVRNGILARSGTEFLTQPVVSR